MTTVQFSSAVAVRLLCRLTGRHLGQRALPLPRGPAQDCQLAGRNLGFSQESSDTLATLKHNLNQSKGSKWKDFDSRIVARHPVGVATLYCKLKKEVGDVQQSLDVSV